MYISNFKNMIPKINNTLMHQFFEKGKGLGFKNLLLPELPVLLYLR